eukprot:15459985-Alexandrium_andersonii.AAC.1
MVTLSWSQGRHRRGESGPTTGGQADGHVTLPRTVMSKPTRDRDPDGPPRKWPTEPLQGCGISWPTGCPDLNVARRQT